MCSVSTVIDGWRDPTWPYWHPAKHTEPWTPPYPGWRPAPNDIRPWSPPGQNAIPWQTIQASPDLASQMLEVLNKLEALDKRLGMMEQCKVSVEEKKKLKANFRRIARKKK